MIRSIGAGSVRVDTSARLKEGPDVMKNCSVGFRILSEGYQCSGEAARNHALIGLVGASKEVSNTRLRAVVIGEVDPRHKIEDLLRRGGRWDVSRHGLRRRRGPDTPGVKLPHDRA